MIYEGRMPEKCTGAELLFMKDMSSTGTGRKEASGLKRVFSLAGG